MYIKTRNQIYKDGTNSYRGTLNGKNVNDIDIVIIIYEHCRTNKHGNEICGEFIDSINQYKKYLYKNSYGLGGTIQKGLYISINKGISKTKYEMIIVTLSEKEDEFEKEIDQLQEISDNTTFSLPF